MSGEKRGSIKRGQTKSGVIGKSNTIQTTETNDLSYEIKCTLLLLYVVIYRFPNKHIILKTGIKKIKKFLKFLHASYTVASRMFSGKKRKAAFLQTDC